MPSSVRAAHSHPGNIRRVSRNYAGFSRPDMGREEKGRKRSGKYEHGLQR